jgi:hypothetical protein
MKLWEYREVVDVEYSDEEIFDYEIWDSIFNVILPEKLKAHKAAKEFEKARQEVLCARRV